MYGLVTGMGRSGTKWVTELLSAGGKVNTSHEISPGIPGMYGKTWKNASEARSVVDDILTVSAQRQKPLIEVNSYLRYSIGAFKERNVIVAAIIRNGLDVIPSLMARKAKLPPKLKNAFDDLGILQPGHDYNVAMYSWYWVDTYEYIASCGIPMFRVEDLTQNFSAYQELAKVFGLPTDIQHYVKTRRHPRNADNRSAQVKLEDVQIKTFYDVAGHVQGTFYG